MSTMSQSSQSSQEPFIPGVVLNSDTGRAYEIQEVLAERRKPFLCVYHARAEGRDYVIKNINPGDFQYQLDFQRSLSSCSNVRTVIDSIREHKLLIYPFFREDLLQFVLKGPPEATRRGILREALRGLIELHDRHIAHNDIKPNNILLNYEIIDTATGEVKIDKVQIADLEDCVVVPPGKWLRGPLCGNQMWRSPEAWARSRQNQASDVFSFGVVMIYVMFYKMVFRVSNDQLHAQESWRYILRRHISYFADNDGLNGLLDHIGEENPFHKRLIELAGDFSPQDPRQPFEYWHFVDPDLRNLVGKMTSLDPTKRISAREALQHRWFSKAL
ncbi:kinase-like protein [Xylona heveae TC161]|uniref:Kinase-like protein n=1 Tax=Xylona heveae (strain CBS 132557 / TC161) TaxID=1328760 RepID=A0A161TH06_XYLHT|nr:kinase-like protein [Xylona heveae TC161]KZF25497.1 kinase-like protein [Xylona heveae TC161]